MASNYYDSVKVRAAKILPQTDMYDFPHILKLRAVMCVEKNNAWSSRGSALPVPLMLR